MQMTSAEFDRRVIALQLASSAVPAARAVLVGGYSINGTARKHGFSVSVVSRLCKRIRETTLCPECGRPRR